MSREAAAALNDSELEKRLYLPAEAIELAQRPAVHWPEVHRQLKGKGVTLQLLWEDTGSGSRSATATAASVSCTSKWPKRTDVTMRQVHRAGEKLFVDYCGQTVPVVDGRTGEVRESNSSRCHVETTARPAVVAT